MLKKAGEQVASMLAGLRRRCWGGVGEGTSPRDNGTWEYDNSKRLMTQRVGGFHRFDANMCVDYTRVGTLRTETGRNQAVRVSANRSATNPILFLSEN